MFFVLFVNGTVISSYWDNANLNSTNAKPATAKLVQFDQPIQQDANFSAIATTLDGMFYGVLDDQILEFTVTDNPFEWEYTEVVWPPGD